MPDAHGRFLGIAVPRLPWHDDKEHDEECQHEWEPYQESRVVDDPLHHNPSQIVDCLKCGAPLIRPRDTRVLMSRDWLEGDT